MPEPVKTSRRYDNTRRREQSAATRRTILDSARRLFIDLGYARCTVAQIASAAGVNADTVYAVIGRKSDIMAELVETAISGQDVAVPAEEREYVQLIQASSDAREKLRIYAAANAQIQARLAPVFLCLRDAAATDDDCRRLWERISGRRAENMHRFAANLRATGRVRADLTDDDVADIIWTMNAPEYWDLLVAKRGWSPDRFRDWLEDAWARLLLAPSDVSRT